MMPRRSAALAGIVVVCIVLVSGCATDAPAATVAAATVAPTPVSRRRFGRWTKNAMPRLPK